MTDARKYVNWVHIDWTRKQRTPLVVLSDIFIIQSVFSRFSVHLRQRIPINSEKLKNTHRKMTKLMEWLSVVLVFLAVYVYMITGEPKFPEGVMFHIKFLPIYLVGLFGVSHLRNLFDISFESFDSSKISKRHCEEGFGHFNIQSWRYPSCLLKSCMFFCRRIRHQPCYTAFSLSMIVLKQPKKFKSKSKRLKPIWLPKVLNFKRKHSDIIPHSNSCFLMFHLASTRAMAVQFLKRTLFYLFSQNM